MSFPRYPKYKDSGVEWLGKVPAHWEVKRLKRACHVFPSNVDKKSHEGETPVRLCNYTDVYYNDTITAGMEFMAATASSDQIAKFTLRAGDMIITKDSETADDIAIGAYVPEDLPGVVCGYHLSMVRPMPGTDGAYVKRLFDSIYAKSCFAVLATGLTRVGLGQYELDNVELPFPPLAEQTKIAEFLDRETGKIDELVAEQRRLMELLKEKRQAVISHAVTRGLNPAAPLKPSGIEWLGDVPAHWIVTRVRYVAEVLDHQRVPVEVAERADRQGDYPYYGASGIIDTIDGYLFDEPLVLVCEDGWNLILRTQPVARPVAGKIWVNNHAHILRPKESDSGLLAAAIELAPFEAFVTGMRQPKLTLEMLKDIPVALPPDVAEQTAIRDFMQCAAAKFDTLTAEAQRAIDLLQERRTALISAAVTGQIDVRHWRESAGAAAAAFT